MKKVTLKDLKESLSEITEIASRGQVIEVTKYNRPFILLSPVLSPNTHIGKNAGQATFVSVADAASKGRFAKVLDEDRGDET